VRVWDGPSVGSTNRLVAANSFLPISRQNMILNRPNGDLQGLDLLANAAKLLNVAGSLISNQ